MFLSFFITIDTSAESREEISLDNGEVVKVDFYQSSEDTYRYEIEFENGHQYSHQQSGHRGTGSGSDDLTGREMDLAQEAMDKHEKIHGDPFKSKRSGHPIGIFIIFLGLLGVIFPLAVWFLQIGWMLDDAEPSELVLIMNRVGGVIFIIFGLFILIG